MWFTETPWPPIFICIAALILVAAAWLRNGKPIFLYATIGLAVACVGIYFFEQWYVTEPEEVEQAVVELAKAVEADDADRTVGFISNLAWQIAVRSAMLNYKIEGGIRITDVQAKYAADGKSVVSRFRANGMGVQKSDNANHHIPTMWELTWQKESGKWRITDIQRLDPLNGEKMGLLDPPN